MELWVSQVGRSDGEFNWASDPETKKEEAQAISDRVALKCFDSFNSSAG